MTPARPYFVSGERSTAQKVHEAVSELGIAIDNLCSFLPQDKVASFAAMGPKDLLQATMSAANETRLVGWHSDLIKAETKLGGITQELETGQYTLAKIESAIEELEEIVKQSQERRSLEMQIDVCDLKKSFKTYFELKNQFDKVKVEKESVKRQRQELQRRNEPIVSLRAKLEKEKKRKMQLHVNAVEDYRAAEKEIGKWRRTVENEAEKAEDIQSALAGVRDDEKRRTSRLATVRESLIQHQNELENQPAVEDVSMLDKEKQALRTKLHQIDNQDHQAQHNITFIQDETKKAQVQLNTQQTNLRKLNDVRASRIKLVGQKDYAVGFAIDWVLKHRDEFEGEICLPPAVEVQMLESRYGPLVESCLSRGQLLTFIATTPRDYKTLNRINDERNFVEIGYGDRKSQQRVRINTYQITPRDLEELNAPRVTDFDNLTKAGFQGWAIDFIEAPNPVLAFCKTCKLAETAVSLDTANIDEASKHGVTKFISKEGGMMVKTDISFSKYGNKAAQQTTNTIRAGLFWGENVDRAAIKRAEDEIAKLMTEQRKREEKIHALASEKKSRVGKREAVKNDLKEVEDRVNQVRMIQRTITRHKTELEQCKRELARLERMPSLHEKRQRMKSQLASSVQQRCKIILKGPEHFKMMERSSSRMSEAIWGIVQAQSDHAFVQSRFEQRQEELEELNERSRTIESTMNSIKKEAAEAQGEYSTLMEELGPKYEEPIADMARDSVNNVSGLMWLCVLVPYLTVGVSLQFLQNRTSKPWTRLKPRFSVSIMICNCCLKSTTQPKSVSRLKRESKRKCQRLFERKRPGKNDIPSCTTRPV